MTKNRNRMASESGSLMADVVIVGGGPAGLSAALWCTELGLGAVIVEGGPDFGGQLLRIHNPIRNYLGFKAATGRQMRDHFVAQVADCDFRRLVNISVTEFDFGKKIVTLGDSEKLNARTIILATGVRRRRLEIEGETEFHGKGILESGAKEQASVRGKRVLIVGGGDAALENALILSRHAKSVTVVHRRPELRAREEFVDAATLDPNITFISETSVTRIDGVRSVEFVELKNSASGGRLKVPTDFVLIRIGVGPNSDLARGMLDLDEQGYIIVDRSCHTSVEGIFAAGDVALPLSPTISSATGSGATAAKASYDWIYKQIRL